MKIASSFAIIATAALASLAWWAFKPLAMNRDASTSATDSSLTDPSSASASSPSGSSSGSSPSLALDLSAFRAPLWVAPPAPPPPPIPAPTKPPPPPLKWQLLAIEHDERGDSALFYDPDGDTLLRLRPGESLGDRAIEKITTAGVEIRDAGTLRTLALRPDRANSADRTTGTATPGGSR